MPKFVHALAVKLQSNYPRQISDIPNDPWWDTNLHHNRPLGWLRGDDFPHACRKVVPIESYWQHSGHFVRNDWCS
jgi:hypothetical protein